MALSEQKRKELQTAKDNIDHLSEVIGKIIDGTMNQSEAAKEFGITPQSWHSDAQKNFMSSIHRITPIKDYYVLDILREVEGPYEKLIRDIFGLNFENVPGLALTEHHEEVLDNIIKDILNEFQISVIEHRYGLHGETPKSLKEIGEIMNKSQERIRQTQVTSLRRLRSPKVWNRLFDHYTDYLQCLDDIEMFHMRHQQFNENYNAKLNVYKRLLQKQQAMEQIDDILSNHPALAFLTTPIADMTDVLSVDEINVLLCNDISMPLDLINLPDTQLYYLAKELNNMEETYEKLNLPIPQTNYTQLNIPIEELELSVRAYNCLKRSQIRTVGDLMQLTHAQLKDLRNLGNKSYEEILDTLKQRNLSLKDEEN